MSKRYSLTTNWQFTLGTETSDLAGIPADAFPIGKWLPAAVPGTIHTDLMANGLLEDPFYRDNERKVQWVDKVEWLYRTEFNVADDFVAEDAVQLVAEGLDTVADIFLNGQPVAHTENMYITHRLAVKKYLRVGKNELRIRFHSPTLHAKALEKKHGQLCHTHESHRLYLRKAQYSFGWDWGPILPTSGIWKPVHLEAFRAARLANVFVDSEVDEALEKVRLTIRIETEWFGDAQGGLQAKIEFDGIEKTVRVDNEQVSLAAEIEKPRMWWPAGCGDQNLYDMSVILLQEGEEIDRLTIRFAIRKLELVREKDKWGESFFFKINNIPVFCKGANWIPSDNFLPRAREEKYRNLLQMAKDANMNMIRVWGGGVYEEDAFYDICDELGLMVWQDFMFACGGYPVYAEYQENVASEIEQVVRRLRNHPSIVLWCGNNENEWIWYGATGISYDDMPGLSLFHELIPEIVERLDPTRPYWPSSPFGGDDPNSQEHGNRHQWDIWSNWTDFTQVRNDHGRFITEFGFQAPPNVATFEKVTLPEDRYPQSEILEFHNKQVDGQERLFRFLAGHVRMPESFDDFIFKSQLVQGEALKTCIEHWRRCKFRTAGSIIWQLNDCWPASSWSLIDSESTPKAAYFYTRRAFGPILVSFSQHGDSLEVWITNDTLESHATLVRITTLSFDGHLLFEEEVQADVPANCSFKAHSLNLKQLHLDKSCHYLKAELWAGDELFSENRHFFKRFKHLDLPKPVFEKAICDVNSDTAVLHLRSSCFAKSVRVAIAEPCQVQDNWFDLDANAEKQIKISFLVGSLLTDESIEISSLQDH